MQISKETSAHQRGGRDEALSSDESERLDDGSAPGADRISSYSGTAAGNGDSSGDSSGSGNAKVFGVAQRPDVFSAATEAVRGAGNVTNGVPWWRWVTWSAIAVVVLAVCQTGRRRRMQKRRGAPLGGLSGPGGPDVRRRAANRP